MRIVITFLGPRYREGPFVPISSLDRDIESHLADKSVRYTSGRRLVVGALSKGGGPRSAAELHSDLHPRVPLSSLYRSLTVLQDAGVIVPHFSAHGITRYELAEWITGHHHHLVCLECGAVEDIDISPGMEARVRNLVDEMAGLVSFTPVSHTLEIEGRCSRCK